MKTDITRLFSILVVDDGITHALQLKEVDEDRLRGAFIPPAFRELLPSGEETQPSCLICSREDPEIRKL